MRAFRPRAIARRLLIVVPLALLAAGATLALAAPPVSAPMPARAVGSAAPALGTVVVPDLRRQAYVFARGILLDEGFAWTVDGATQGYPANIVVSQTPTPGTRLVDTGAPTIHLQLARNPHSPEVGNPTSGSSYSGTEVVTPAAAAAAAKRQVAEEKRRVAEEKRRARAAAAAVGARKIAAVRKAVAARTAVALRRAAVAANAAAAPKGAAAQRAKVMKTAVRAKKALGATRVASARVAAATAKRAASARLAAAAKRRASARNTAGPRRPAAFAVAGAPREPTKEMPLPVRARLLARWIAHRPALTAANRHHFLFQHAWVVTGARFGWWQGAAALRTLVAADRQFERQWRLVAAQRVEAERALFEVGRRSAG